MATRATIKIEGINEMKVYKHWDGNPKSTLPWLESFNESFTQGRGIDSSYKIAQLLRSSINDAKEFDLDGNLQTGWGLVPYSDDCGAEFEYELLNNGKVTVKELN